MNQTELFYQSALTAVPGVGGILIRQLMSHCGSASEVFKSSFSKLIKIPGIGDVTARSIRHPDVLRDAEQTVQRCEKLGIQQLFYTDKRYPHRLKALYDSPAMLYWQGGADLNAVRTIGLVGTRQATDYGRHVTEEIIQALRPYQPLVISGLAYGIDIAAHRASLLNGLPTIGVMASGVDIVYPHVHKKTAQEMTLLGGLLTENRPGVKPDARLFPARNRIIAGMSDSVVVVEAAVKGGALITAEYANNYHREVFAVPGHLNQPFSQGCNKLIHQNKAQIYTKPEDLIEALNWDQAIAKNEPGHELVLTREFTEEESQILALFRQQSEWQIDELSWRTEVHLSKLASLLLNLEFKGIIRTLPGKKYRIN
ncbi:DNA-processing protein DprA [Larkinella harenae]